MNSTRIEKFLIFTGIYKKRNLFLLGIAITTLGITATILEFFFGSIVFFIPLLIAQITWFPTIFLPFFRKITHNENANKKNVVIHITKLNRNFVLAERILSIFLVFLGVATLYKVIIDGISLYPIIKCLWIVIIGIIHFLLLIVTRGTYKP